VKGLGPRNRIKRGVYTKKGESIFIIKGRERESASICGRSVTKRVHLSLQVTANVTSTFCGKKGWKKENGTRLLTHKPVDNKKRIPATTYRGHTRQSRKKEGVYEIGFEVGLQ